MRGEYLHLFDSDSEFKEYVTGPDYQDPFVGITKIGGGNTYKVNYNLSEYERLLNAPLTFEITSDGDILWIGQMGITVEYKKNNGDWVSITSTSNPIMTTAMTTSSGNVYYHDSSMSYAYSGESGTVYAIDNPLQVGSKVYGDIMSAYFQQNPIDTVVSVEQENNAIHVQSGDTLQFRGDNATYGLPASVKFGSTCSFNLKGNIMSMIDSDDFATATTLGFYAFGSLFNNCTGLTDASNLVLPATTLAPYCYNSMFNGCTGLTVAPSLPATTLAEQCYAYMFNSCTSLTIAPELPATTLAQDCYYQMFANCHSLNYIKCLATDISATNSTTNWLYGVSPSGTFATDASTNWSTGVDGIPENWVIQRSGFGLSRNNIALYESGSSEQITVTSTNNTWTAMTNDSWISLSQNTGTTGETTVIITITATSSPRNGNIVFTDGNKTSVLDIIQNNNLVTPLTFEITSNGDICWKASNTAYTCTIEYSKNGGEWTSVTSSAGGTSISVVSGDTVQFRGNNAAYSRYSSNKNVFSGTTCSFNLKGNMMSMIDSDDFATATTLESANTFYDMFTNCTGLTDASKLLLPATTLAIYCYSNMFSGCTSLTTAPALPATTLANGCYQSMFQGCTSLTSAPELPATTLATGCYYSMFAGCTSLTSTPTLSSTNLANYCYLSMFEGCTSLTSAPALPATTLADYCYSYMFVDCTGLTTAPELPATTLASSCYSYMFYGCTSLTTAPALPATTLAQSCYNGMFQGCTNLVNVPSIGTSATTIAASACTSMFEGCTSLTTAPELPATTLATGCYYSMFNGCTSLTTVPSDYLPATTLATGCYYGMFAGCSNLISVPSLPATTLANKCYQYMFAYCTGLTSVPSNYLPVTTLADYCYYAMFQGCISLTTAPALPATTLADYCYCDMFFGCTSLTTVPSDYLPATTLAIYCYYEMFRGCTSLTTAPALPATTLATGCYYRMFLECVRLNYIKCLATDVSASSCTDYWTYGVANSGTFVKSEDMTSWTTGINGIPTNWTVEDAS